MFAAAIVTGLLGMAAAAVAATNHAEVSVAFRLHNSATYPVPLSATKFTPGDTFVDIGVDTGINTAAQPGVWEPPATHINLDFDNSYKFTTKGMPECHTNLAPLTLTQAANACPRAQLAVTQGSVCIQNLPNCSSYNSEMILYNVKPRNGKPRFQVWVEDYGQDTPALEILRATLVNAPDSEAGMGKRLSITLPQNNQTTKEITELPFNIFDKKWQVLVHHHRVTRHFIAARCDDGNHVLDASVAINYVGGGTMSATPIAAYKCTVAP